MLYILFLHLSRTIVDHRILKKCLPVLSLRAWRPSSTHEDAEQIYTPIKLPTSHISHLWKGNSTVVSSESFQKNGSELETVRKFFRKLLYLHHISTDFPYVSLQNAIPWSPCPDPDRPDDHLVKPDRLGITSQLPTPIFGADETSSETTSSARSGLVDMELENTYNYIYIYRWHDSDMCFSTPIHGPTSLYQKHWKTDFVGSQASLWPSHKITWCQLFLNSISSV